VLSTLGLTQLQRITESHSDNSWLRYVNSTSLDGAWADPVIIQAHADSLNLSIRIVKSNELSVLVSGLFHLAKTKRLYSSFRRKTS